MLKVMIVDDEPVIRFGIKASIDWEKEGFVVIGDCANGKEALDRMETAPVDILITDIKMPLMDGISLTREALKLNPQLKVILVSSYNDYEYVREGLKLGVVDYILKHMLQPEELLQVVQKAREQYYEDKLIMNKLEDAHEGELIRKRKKYEYELKRLLITKTDTLNKEDYPEWIDDQYLTVYVILNRVRLMEETLGFLYTSIVVEQIMEEFYKNVPFGIIVSTANNALFFIIPGIQSIEERLTKLKIQIECKTEASISLGYDIGYNYTSIKSCYQHSKEACGRGFFEGEGIYHYQEKPYVDREGYNLPSMLPGSFFLSNDQFDEVLISWKSYWMQGGISPEELKEEASRVISVAFKNIVDPFTLVESFDRLFKTETLDELCDQLRDQLSDLRKHSLDKKDPYVSNNPVDIALEYIHTHYLEAVTLQQLADFVHVSKNYFSILFKKNTGQNFIDYMISLRVLKAKELLVDSELKIYEIAEHAGFNDVKYFSKLFKKISGLSPIEYREHHR